MAVELFTANEASTNVATGGTTAPAQGTTETWTVASSTAFPAAATGVSQFHVADPASAGTAAEIIAVTNVSGTTWTVTRGAESTTPVAHTAGFTVQQVITVASLSTFAQAGNGDLGGTGTAPVVAKVNGVAVTGTPSSGNVIVASSGTAAAWQAPAYAYHPWQFTPESYGAKGDGKLISDAAMTGGSATLTSATANFTSADAGKSILVWVNSTTSWIFGTISTYTNPTTVTLSVTNSAASFTGAGACYGTDDTAAIQSAVNAASTRAQLGDGATGEVVFSDKIYCVATAPTIGGATEGNAQITLPVISPSAGSKINLSLKGTGIQAPVHWTAPQPQQSGTVILGMRLDATLDATYGPGAVIGGPYNGYGGPNLWSNVHLIVDGITILIPPAGGTPTPYSGIDLFGIVSADVPSFAYSVLGLVKYTGSSTVWPYLGGSLATPANSFGLRMPTVGDNAWANVGIYMCHYAQYGLIGADHLNVDSLVTFYCNCGWIPGSGYVDSHGTHISLWSSEKTVYPVASLTGGGQFGSPARSPITVGMLDLETFTYVVNDTNGSLSGEVYFENLTNWGTYHARLTYSTNNIPGVRLIDTANSPGAITSPSGAPATTAAWPNYYYRDAEMTLSVSGGTLSALTIDGVAQTIPASTTFYRFTLPGGHSYVPTYTGTLTHTVTLL